MGMPLFSSKWTEDHVYMTAPTLSADPVDMKQTLSSIKLIRFPQIKSVTQVPIRLDLMNWLMFYAACKKPSLAPFLLGP